VAGEAVEAVGREGHARAYGITAHSAQANSWARAAAT
jgi:hypothetical protein